MRPSRAREGKIDGKISVKRQFALNIWNFCEKGECGALAMIYLVRLSQSGIPDVLWLLRKTGGHTDMSQVKNNKKFRIAGSSACPAAVDARWFQIRPFGSSPEKGTVFLSPNKGLYKTST